MKEIIPALLGIPLPPLWEEVIAVPDSVSVALLAWLWARLPHQDEVWAPQRGTPREAPPCQQDAAERALPEGWGLPGSLPPPGLAWVWGDLSGPPRSSCTLRCPGDLGWVLVGLRGSSSGWRYGHRGVRDVGCRAGEEAI